MLSKVRCGANGSVSRQAGKHRRILGSSWFEDLEAFIVFSSVLEGGVVQGTSAKTRRSRIQQMAGLCRLIGQGLKEEWRLR
jgi:hypothetical protein